MPGIRHCFIGAILLVWTVPPSMAQVCLPPSENSAATVLALKTELMISALQCSGKQSYNTVILRFRGEMLLGERTLRSWFTRNLGERAYDEYVTNLANYRSREASMAYPAYCQGSRTRFSSAMSIRKGGLAAYASRLDIAGPLGIPACLPGDAKR